mgnify:FL=1
MSEQECNYEHLREIAQFHKLMKCETYQVAPEQGGNKGFVTIQ